MKISLSMDLGQLAEGMGTEATHGDARRLREVLVRSGFENLEDLPDGAWWRMVDEAFKDWRPTPTPETTMTTTRTLADTLSGWHYLNVLEHGSPEAFVEAFWASGDADDLKESRETIDAACRATYAEMLETHGPRA